ncbi:MAG: hypothetical protein JXA24_05770 [Proteobacteria bacterium]|nr:hypothetical protein [Pseudomonadota bacterium]
MVAPIVWGLIALGSVVVGAVGCGDDDDAGGGTDLPDLPDAGTDADADADADSDTGTDTVDAGPDPWVRDGFNGLFYQFEYGSVGSMLDMDIDRDELPDEVVLMTGHSHNRMGRLNLDAADAMSAPTQNFQPGAIDGLGAAVDGVGDVRPVQVVKLADGNYFVPSAIDVGASSNAKGLLSLVYSDYSSYPSMNVKSSMLDFFCEAVTEGEPGETHYTDDVAECSPFDTDPDAGEVNHPHMAMSGIMIGGTVYVAAASEYDGSGSVIGFGVTPQGYIDAGHPQVVIPTSGDFPSAIEYLGDNRAAVLNTGGGSTASIDIVDLLDAQIEATIPLGMSSAAALYELPITGDGNYAVVSASNFAMQANILIVDMQAHQVVGTANLTENGEVRGIDLLGTDAYVSIEGDSSKETSGEVAIVDFSAPASPHLDRLIAVGNDMGAIAVHGSGVVFVVVTDRWWEVAGEAEKRWSYIVAFDPAQVTEDQISD